MARSDLIQLEGVITSAANTIFGVKINDSEVVMSCKPSGKMRKHRIKVAIGDKVKIEVSPYTKIENNSPGIICRRL
jgi:translation initiation factor IF-1